MFSVDILERVCVKKVEPRVGVVVKARNEGSHDIARIRIFSSDFRLPTGLFVASDY